MKRLCLMTAAAAVLSMMTATTRAAVIVSNFEPGSGTYNGGVQGWFPYGTQGISTIANPTGGGASTWADIDANQYYAKITAQDWAVPGVTTADWIAADNLEFDILLPGSGPTVWLPNGNATVDVEFNTHTGGAGAVAKHASATVNGALKDTVQHVSIPLASLQPFDATPNWDLSINLYPGYDWGWDGGNTSGIAYDAHWYLDNVQFTNVPEPASMTLIALAGVLAMRRNRRGHSG